MTSRDADVEADPAPPGFSDLRTRVGVRDGGRFSYHLRKLRGRLVERTGDGYALTADDERAARLV